MKLELEEPFKSLWQNGYINIDETGRKRVILYNNHNDRSTTSYARYLLCVKIGKLLPTEIEADHVDNDFTNDSIINIQPLHQTNNILKEKLRYLEEEQIVYGVQCACCGIKFMITERNVKMKLAQNVEYAFCSRSCASRFNSTSSSGAKNTTDVERIKALKQQGLSSYKISEITGYARNTVMKHW